MTIELVAQGEEGMRKYAAAGSAEFAAGEKVYIGRKNPAEEIFLAEVPAHKKWTVAFDVDVTETNA